MSLYINVKYNKPIFSHDTTIISLVIKGWVVWKILSKQNSDTWSQTVISIPHPLLITHSETAVWAGKMCVALIWRVCHRKLFTCHFATYSPLNSTHYSLGCCRSCFASESNPQRPWNNELWDHLWADHKWLWPDLRRIYQVSLSIPVTWVPADKDFSLHNQTKTARQNGFLLFIHAEASQVALGLSYHSTLWQATNNCCICMFWFGSICCNQENFSIFHLCQYSMSPKDWCTMLTHTYSEVSK